jgi:hypothetical protein
VTSVYGNEGQVSCVPADSADNVPELSLVPVLSEDNDVCTRESDPSGSLVLAELY